MRITMKATKFGSPNGIQVNEYEAGQAYDVPADLGNDFIAAGVALSDEPADPITLTWPPTEDQLNEMSFSALGVLLEGKDVALGPLKGVEARLAAIRELIEAEKKPPSDEKPLPWPPTADEIDTMPLADLSRYLVPRAPDFQGDEAASRAKLHELVKAEEKPALPTDAEIDAMDEATLATLLTARNVDVGPISLDEGRAQLKELIASERTAQE